MSEKKLEKKVEEFIEKTLIPAFTEVGENLYQSGVKTKFTSKPWKSEISPNSFFQVFDVALSHEGNEFCQISSYLSIQDESRIRFGSSIRKNYGSETKSELLIESIEKIDKNKLVDDLMGKI